MTTVTATPRQAPAVRLLKPTTVAESVSFGRLTLVEARKFVDTRTGTWLLGIGVGLSLIIAIGAIAFFKPMTEALGTSWMLMGSLIGTPVNLLVPVMVILLFTSEWTQRTSLTTFSLEPRRGRVLLAKGVVAVGVAVAMWLMQYLISAGGSALAGAVHGVDINWTMGWTTLFGSLATLILSCAMAAGFGMLLMNSPAAIVTYIAIPQLLALLGLAGGTAAKILAWINLGDASAPLFNGEWGRWDGLQLVAASVLWIIIPVTVGVIRTLRIEAK